MRVELFVKDTPSLIKQACALVACGASGLNLPQKSSSWVQTEALHALRSSALPEAAFREVCPHYSLKFNYGGSPARTLDAFEAFCREAHALNVRQILLVSGSGSRRLDAVACLRGLRLRPEDAPEIGVAFNPYAGAGERARLEAKIGTGWVSSVWLQIGDDLDALRDGLRFLRELDAGRPRPLRLYGSVLLPSPQLLAQFRFRPWAGVSLSPAYLSSVPAAEAATRAVLGEYAEAGVRPLLESAVRSEAEWARARALLEGAGTCDTE